jgi:hypothetical protein
MLEAMVVKWKRLIGNPEHCILAPNLFLTSCVTLSKSLNIYDLCFLKSKIRRLNYTISDSVQLNLQLKRITENLIETALHKN